MTAVTPGREALLARGFEHARDWGASETVVPMLAAFAQAEIARLAAKPADEGVREALLHGFVTACSGDGEYQIKIGFETLAEMQAAHAGLVGLCK